MSTSVTALCQLLIDDNFGQLAAQLFETLCIHGRLTFPALLQHGGNPRRVKQALAVLIQHAIVLWTADSNETAFYEVSLQNAYNLVRQGRLARMIGERFDQLGQSVVTTLLLSGHSRVSDVLEALVADKEKEEERRQVAQPNGHAKSGSNGHSFDTDAFMDSVRSTVLAMVDQGYLSVAHESHFMPMSDAQKNARSVALEAHGEKVKKVDEPAFEGKIRRHLLNWKFSRLEREEILATTGLTEVKVMKRRRMADEDLANTDHSPKKRRLNDGTSDSRLKLVFKAAAQSRLSSLDEHVVKINFDKLAVITRNEQLAALVKSRLGDVTSLVYEEVLDVLTRGTLFCQGLTDPGLQALLESPDDGVDLDGPLTVSTTKITTGIELPEQSTGLGSAAKIKKSLTNGTKSKREHDSDDDLEMHDMPNGKMTNGHPDTDEDEAGDEGPRSPASKRKKRTGINKQESEDDQPMGDVDTFSDNPNLLIRSHLLLLKEDSFRFVERHQATHLSPESWSVNLKSTTKELRTSLILDIIRARFGMSGLRLVNLLRARGKLEQKTLEGTSLLPKKTVLLVLTALHTAGFIDLQEVPRDSTRAPVKTIYLWFFDEARARTRVLEDAYKAMVRIMQRIKVERDNHDKVILKSQRTDVAENEDELLSEREKRELKAWRDGTDKLVGELGRLDDMVFCLRDF